MQAITTKAFGYSFRSRLEARWATVFQNLGLSWEYEPEGFETDKGRYLPDFLIRRTPDVWVEIKPPIPLTKHDSERIFSFARSAMSSHASVGVLVLRGTPPGSSAFLFHKSELGERAGPINPKEFALCLGVSVDELLLAASIGRTADFQ